jgi:hypothetical protein
MILRNFRVPFLCLFALLSIVTLAQTPRKSRGWEPTKELLASNPNRRMKSIQHLQLTKGDYLLVMLTTQCQECERTALKLNQRSDLDRILAITPDPETAVTAWRQKLGLKFRVLSVSEEIFDGVGPVLLPTLVLLRNGQPLAAREDAPRDEKDVPNLPAPPAKAAPRRN